ncbi:hypothetical protein DPMN_192264 [Dreissena polymorpha]|uniref:Uncharacterized protein n=1 Tax=Dreissena polymorpha TaxID=45954 RepID=A0A9D4B5I6_DREPO|nr:hypothetical protein DPMN_192264 [Dreissena polymorpha]
MVTVKFTLIRRSFGKNVHHRIACQKREQKGDYLMYGLKIPGFTLHMLADMRGTGVVKPRPLLDQEKLDLFRGKTIQGTGYCILKVHTAK